jgi:hypothetical protein
MTVREQETLLQGVELWQMAVGAMSWEARAEAALALLIVRDDEIEETPAPHSGRRDQVIAAIYARYARVLIATLALLACATSASAECAWVLWAQAAGSGGTILAVPLGAWQERDRCEQDRASREQALPRPEPGRFVCLPDTVDPRGPKGK